MATGDDYALLVLLLIDAAAVENSVAFPGEIKNRTTIRSSHPTSWYMSEGNEITVTKRYLHAQIYLSIFPNGQYMETI